MGNGDIMLGGGGGDPAMDYSIPSRGEGKVVILRVASCYKKADLAFFCTPLKDSIQSELFFRRFTIFKKSIG